MKDTISKIDQSTLLIEAVCVDSEDLGIKWKPEVINKWIYQ